MKLARRAAGGGNSGARTAAGVAIPTGWALQRLDTFGTANSVPGPVRLHTLYYEGALWNRDSDNRVSIPNGVINNQQQTYQHFEDATWSFLTDRLRIQGRGQGDSSIKSGQLNSKFTSRSFIFEARIKIPTTLGTWGEFWAYPGASPADTSELDVELLISMDGSSFTNHHVSLNNHPYAAPSGDPTGDDSHFSFNSGTGLLDYINASFDFSVPHYYTIYYDDTGSGTVRRYIDGVLIYHNNAWKWNQSVGGTGNGPDASLILDLAAGSGASGGQFPGTITSPITWSGDMDIYSIGLFAPGSAGRAVPAGEAWDVNQCNAHVTLSGGDLIVTTATNATDQPCYALDSMMGGTGKYYWEIVTNGSTDTPGCGIGTYSSSITDGDYVGRYNNHLAWYSTGGVTFFNAIVATWATFGPGSVRLCFALDMVNNKLWGRVGTAGNWNNDVIGNQNPATNTGGYAVPSTVRFNVVPAVNLKNTSDTAMMVAASGSWAGTPPSGFGQIGPT